MKKLTLLIAFGAIFCVSVFAKTPNGSIKGRVADGGRQEIIDAATVSLFAAKDSSLIKVNLTDKKGNFVFDKVPFGKYFLLATSAGHYKTYSSVIEVKSEATVDVGELQLKEEAKSLKEITVIAKRPFIERKIDRTIVNVDQSITNAGTTALEVLEKSPGVTVDKDGNVSLKGKQGVVIMMDGRPTYLSGQELANLLKNMPSSGIDQIEIMTNPSAKFDAAGNSGVINIKTKKNKMKGMNGSVTASVLQSNYTKTNNSFNINYRSGKVNLFGNYSYSLWQGDQSNHFLRNFRNTNTKKIETIFDQVNKSKYNSQEHNLKAGMDFYANKKTTLGVVFSGYINPNKNTSVNRTNLNDSDNKIDSIALSDNVNNQRSNNFATNLNLRHIFDSTGKEFTIDVDYLTYFQTSDQTLVSNYLNPDLSVNRPPDELKGDLPSKVNIYSAKSDFTFPLKNTSKIKQIKKWGIQTGLRAENTNSEGHQLGNSANKDSLFVKNYINLFPTVYVSYEANKKNTFSVNYGRRIDRPDYQDLNPFYYFLDEYTYQVGNTLLQPQFSDNFELSHTYNGFLSTTLNYSETHHAFSDVIKQITSERKTFQTKENIATKTNYGIAVSANVPVTKFWNSNIYTNVSSTSYKGELSGGILNVQATTFMANMNNQLKFKKGWSAELSGFYRSKGIESQIVINPLWRMDAGVQKQILKNKGSLKLSVRDIFNSQNFSGYVNYQDIDLKIKNTRINRTVSLTFSYRFGKPIKNQQQRKTGGASEEQSRIKTSSN